MVFSSILSDIEEEDEITEKFESIKKEGDLADLLNLLDVTAFKNKDEDLIEEEEIAQWKLVVVLYVQECNMQIVQEIPCSRDDASLVVELSKILNTWQHRVWLGRYFQPSFEYVHEECMRMFLIHLHQFTEGQINSLMDLRRQQRKALGDAIYSQNASSLIVLSVKK